MANKRKTKTELGKSDDAAAKRIPVSPAVKTAEPRPPVRDYEYPEYPENAVGRVQPGFYRAPGSDRNADASIAVD
jgi:hypothetical protein